MAQRYIPKSPRATNASQARSTANRLSSAIAKRASRAPAPPAVVAAAQPLSAQDRRIAETLGPVLAARGLLLVGLDVIGDFLTEVNVTSPTCFREIQDQTGYDVAGSFIDSLEKKINGGTR